MNRSPTDIGMVEINPSFAPSDDERKRCPVCKGRGYHRCPCWPGDCICGQDDEDCETCDGDGWLYPDEYDFCFETVETG